MIDASDPRERVVLESSECRQEKGTGMAKCLARDVFSPRMDRTRPGAHEIRGAKAQRDQKQQC